MKIKTEEEDSESELQLYKAILTLKNVEEAKQFFEDLCTPTERQALADRWRVVDLIKKKKPYRTICKETKVSVTTIGRVAGCLMRGAGGYNLVYERILKKNTLSKRT